MFFDETFQNGPKLKKAYFSLCGYKFFFAHMAARKSPAPVVLPAAG
jgi:hypothetical protein